MTAQRTTTSLDESIIESALTAYLYSSRCSPAEARRIRQKRYAEEHGTAEVTADAAGERLALTLSVDGEGFDVAIPKHVDEVVLEKDGHTVRLHDIDLLAACLRSDFPWTDEAFVAYYLPGRVEDDGHDWYATEKIVLHRYEPPRGCYESEDASDMVETWHDTSRELLTKSRHPNPWEYASLFVVYENTELAREFLNRSEHAENLSVFGEA